MRGVPSPRLAPPVPAKSLIREYEAAAKEQGIGLMAWQKIAGRYLTALGEKPPHRPRKEDAGDRWKYREVCIVVARQNGKTTLLLPFVRQRLAMGRRILHTAQNRAIPRETFLALVQALAGDPNVTEIRLANGQEVIRYANGGRYTLVAPRPGVRGYPGIDDVILDEVREHRNYDIIGAIKPTLTASRNWQMLYLSNAGDTDSVVLNDLRKRADSDPAVAYLEWSAAEERDLDDVEGWREANPALGITIQPETLIDFRRSLPPAIWETEHLCRWVTSTRPALVEAAVWAAGRAELAAPVRPVLALSLDPSGARASAALAWQAGETVALRIVADVTGEPIDLERFGTDLRALALKLRVAHVVYDPYSEPLARYFHKPTKMTGQQFTIASGLFVQLLEGGKLHWQEAEPVGADLPWATRRTVGPGIWLATAAKADRPVTAVLAAIRAVGTVAGPRPAPARIY